jgi:deoxyhypusine monooxygenase
MICDRVLDSRTSVAGRMRGIFALKGWGGPGAVLTLAECMRVDESVLVKHEAAYCLGQMKDPSAIPYLERRLRDPDEDVIVRHEAAESLGAIGGPASLPILDEYSGRNHPQEVFETCLVAAARIRFLQDEKTGSDDAVSGYSSVDPAPPSGKTGGNVPELGVVLCDPSLKMFTRYRAMFALRNRGGEEAVLSLCHAMRAEGRSALFRHEIAFVLGQMQHPAAIPTLAAFLKDDSEHEMVRHESAEALGSISTPEAQDILMRFRADKNRIVRESVHVALDIAEYNCDNAELHYTDLANGELKSTDKN